MDASAYAASPFAVTVALDRLLRHLEARRFSTERGVQRLTHGARGLNRALRV